MKPIMSELELEEELSRPYEEDVAAAKRLNGDLLLLGVGGKMGPSLAHRAKRAIDLAGVPHRVIAVARFTDPGLPNQLASWGVETIAADLLEPGALDKLPDPPNVIYMAARKFGTTGMASHLGQQRLPARSRRGAFPAFANRRVLDRQRLSLAAGILRRGNRGNASRSGWRIWTVCACTRAHV